MPTWVPVHGVQDQSDVSADTVNKPLFELAERTNYLKSRLDALTETASPFEAVRMYDMPLVADGALAPSVKDIVCLYPEQAAYGKAIASMDLVDEFATAIGSYAVGILIAKTDNLGTILVYGKLPLETAATSWTLSELLEPGQEFRDGPYYLSAVAAGKLTATPSGPSVFVGSFVADPLTPGVGGTANVAPLPKDTGNTHNHRTIKLHSQPAGRQVIIEGGTGYVDGRHYVVGFSPLAAADAGDRLPRLVPLGDWTSADDIQYTLWLSNSSGTDRATSLPPTGFNDAYLHWVSSEAYEGPGSVRITAFEIPVAIGSHGLKVAFENPAGVTPAQGTDWSVLFTEASGSDVDKRTWELDIPLDAAGWLANNTRQYCDNHQAADSGFSVIVMGGPDSGPLSDTVTIKCAQIHSLDTTTVPAADDTVRIGTLVFEFTDDGTVTDPTHVAVAIDSVDNDTTYSNLAAAILDQADPDIAVAFAVDTLLIGVAPGLHGVTPGLEVGIVFGGVPFTIPVTSGGTGPGVVTVGSGDVSLLVSDRESNSLIDTGNFFWAAAEYWQPITLANGLQLMLVPYSAAGVAAVSDSVSASDYWITELTNTGSGAPFRYAVGMQSGLALYYPPIPAKAAALVLNGVELDSDMFFDNGTYRCAPDTLYWTASDYGRVPWPMDWVDRVDTGAPELAHKLLLHFTRNVIGETGYVSSLRPAADAPITVTRFGTDEAATTGDLQVNFNLDFSAEDAGLSGFNVVKSVRGNKLRRGPVVEKVLAGPGITVTQKAGSPAGQGTVIIGLEDADMSYAGDFEEIALENAKQEMIGLFPYIKLLGWTTGGASNRASGFTAKFRVPHTIADAQYRVVVYATVFGESNVAAVPDAAVPYAGLQFSYAVLPDVTAIGTLPATSSLNLADNLLTPDAPINVAVPMGDNSRLDYFYKAYDPMLIHNNPDEIDANKPGFKAQVLGTPFPSPDDQPDYPSELGVRPGSLVAVRFSRANLVSESADEYTQPIGIINLRWMLVQV